MRRNGADGLGARDVFSRLLTESPCACPAAADGVEGRAEPTPGYCFFTVYNHIHKVHHSAEAFCNDIFSHNHSNNNTIEAQFW